MKQSTFHQRQTDQAVRIERNFWQLVVILGALGGVILGVGFTRVHAALVRTTALNTDSARTIHLEAEVLRMRAECAPPVLQALCDGDSLGGPCALSWARVLRPTRFRWTFARCGGHWSGRIDWTPHEDINPEDPAGDRP